MSCYLCVILLSPFGLYGVVGRITGFILEEGVILGFWDSCLVQYLSKVGIEEMSSVNVCAKIIY